MRRATTLLRRKIAAPLAGLIALALLTLSAPGPAAALDAQGPDAITFRQLSSDVNSSDARVRRAALKALATLGPEALDPISLLIADPVRDIRRDAILAVARIYVEPPPKRRVSSVEDAFDWSPYLASQWVVPPVLTTNLVRALADDWPSERRDAAYALGIVLMPPVEARVVEELTYSLADPAAEVRLAAVRALGRLRATAAGDLLIGRIVDADLPVRLAAMRAVGDIREARALAALRQQVDYYGTATAGRTALDALARIAHSSTAGFFEQERFSDRAANRRIAYEALARLGGIRDADAAATEQRLAEERDPAVRVAMAFALATAGRPYVERVVEAVGDGNLADQSIEYLVELGRARPQLLVPQLQQPDPVLRSRVAIAAGLAGSPLLEPELSRLTADGDPAVRRAAESAVLRLRTSKRPPPSK